MKKNRTYIITAIIAIAALVLAALPQRAHATVQANGNGLYATYTALNSSDITKVVEGEGPIDHGWTGLCGSYTKYEGECADEYTGWAGVYNASSSFEETLTGYIEAPITGDFVFSAWIDDYLEISIGGVSDVADDPGGDGYTINLHMEEGQFYPVSMHFKNRWGSADLFLAWEVAGTLTYEAVPKAYLYTPDTMPPPMPSSFYGEVHTIDTPPGGIIRAYLPTGGNYIAEGNIVPGEAPDYYPVYRIDVPGDIAGTPLVEGGVEGDVITFRTEAGRELGTAWWHSGTHVALNFHPPYAHLTGPADPVYEGVSYSFSGQTSEDWLVEPSYVNWFDWDDNHVYDQLDSIPIAHTFPDNGAYTINLKVTDALGGEGFDSKTFTVVNVPPTATLINDGSVNEGSPVTVSFIDQADAAADLGSLHYAFDCNNGDLSGIAYGDAGTDDHTTCTFPNDSVHTVKGRVIDKDEGNTEYTTDVTVNNAAPTVTVDNGTVTVTEGAIATNTGTFSDLGMDTVTVSASIGTVTQDEEEGTWSWSFQTTDGPDETQDVTITADDGDGGTATTTFHLVVNNDYPHLTIDKMSVTVNEGQTANNTGTWWDAGNDTVDVYSYAVGQVSKGASNWSWSFVTNDGGAQSQGVQICATDRDAGVGICTSPFTLTVNNVAPTATFGNSGPVNEGSPVIISFTAQSDPSSVDLAAGLHYAFACDGGSLASATYATSGTGSTTTCTYPDGPASPVVRGRIFDKDGGYTEYTTEVTVNNAAPVVTLDAGNTYTWDESSTAVRTFNFSATDPAGGDDTFVLTFDCSIYGLHLPAGDTDHSFDCMFGDGPIPEGVLISVSADDGEGGIGSASHEVVINNVAPVVTLLGNDSADEGATVHFTFSTYDPATEYFTNVVSECGTGATLTNFVHNLNTGAGSFDCTFPDGPADYVVRVVERDDEMGISPDATITVEVANLNPTATFNSPDVNEGTDISLSLTSPVDPGADTFQYQFDCGLGGGWTSLSSTNTASCPTTDNGTRNVKGRIVDDDGGFTEYTDTVTINDVLPSGVSAGGPYFGTAGLSVNLAGSATCASVDTCTYTWDLDEDLVYDDASGATPSHTWMTVDVYTIGVKVTDDDGNEVTAAGTVTIAAAVHSIPLIQGWNLVSFRVIPTSTAIASVLASVSGNYDLVYAWDGNGGHEGSGHWLRADTIPQTEDSLTDLDNTMGFWIHMTAADTLDVMGTIPASTDIALHTTSEGWNLVGYPSAIVRGVPGALPANTTIIYAYVAADTTDPWELYEIGTPPYGNDMETLTSGLGYWIKVDAPETWSLSY